jgi:subtilisin family serine protease
MVKQGDFHAWIERDETGQARFLKPEEIREQPVNPKKILKESEESSFYKIDDRHTLSSIACGEKTIVVGSYNARLSKTPLAPTSSSGPSLNTKAKNKPDLSAPGEFILAAHSRTLVMRNRASGTSLSAPVVTGIVASMLSAANDSVINARGVKLSAGEIRQLLVGSLQKDVIEANPEETEDGWHPRYGYGRVSKQDAIAAVLAKISPQSAKPDARKGGRAKKTGRLKMAAKAGKKAVRKSR